jgi:hypothetical protein
MGGGRRRAKEKGPQPALFRYFFMLPVGLADFMQGTLLRFACPVNWEFRIGFPPVYTPQSKKNRAF